MCACFICATLVRIRDKTVHCERRAELRRYLCNQAYFPFQRGVSVMFWKLISLLNKDSFHQPGCHCGDFQGSEQLRNCYEVLECANTAGKIEFELSLPLHWRQIWMHLRRNTTGRILLFVWLIQDGCVVACKSVTRSLHIRGDAGQKVARLSTKSEEIFLVRANAWASIWFCLFKARRDGTLQ